MKEKILEFVGNRGGGVSCVELCSHVDGFSGSYDWFLYTNTIIWSNMSAEAITAMNELLKERSLIVVGSTPLVYMCDGQMLNLPLAKRPKSKYKKPHWLPVVFWTAEQHKKLK